MIISDGIQPSHIGGLCLWLVERLCRSEKWLTSPAKWHKCPVKSNTVLPEECEWRQRTRLGEEKKKNGGGITARVWAGRAAHTYMDMVTSLWFMRTLGLPPGPDRDGRLFKRAFPPRAARETSGRPEQSASSFIKHLRARSLLDTRITFEIPPVTSQPPKHGSWSFKYLHEMTEEGFHPWEQLRWNKMCSWQREKHCFGSRGSHQATL